MGIFGLPSTISRPTVATFDNLGITTAVPRYFMLKKGLIRALWQSFDDVTAGTYTPEIAIGGILNFEAFQFPQTSERQGPWKLTPVQSENDALKRVPYPNPEDPTVADPHKMTYQLPNNVYLSNREDIKVGWWDNEQKKWVSGAEECEKCELESPDTVSFEIGRFAPFAILQSRCTDYPYQGWKIRSVADEKVILTVETKRLELNFEIGPEYVKLIERDEQELKHIVD